MAVRDFLSVFVGGQVCVNLVADSFVAWGRFGDDDSLWSFASEEDPVVRFLLTRRVNWMCPCVVLKRSVCGIRVDVSGIVSFFFSKRVMERDLKLAKDLV